VNLIHSNYGLSKRYKDLINYDLYFSLTSPIRPLLLSVMRDFGEYCKLSKYLINSFWTVQFLRVLVQPNYEIPARLK
jgi:hypothetical protein